MQHEDIVRLQHMLDHAIEAHQMAIGKARDDLNKDRQLNLALVRLLEIVGEAASKVSVEIRKEHEQFPWREIVGLRNRLIHGYDSVDFDILWSIIQEDLPPLIKQVKKMLNVL